MNKKVLNETERQAIIRLQDDSDMLRERLGISERGCVIYRADVSYGDDEVIIVEADGFGGAVLRVVEGNYPLDFFTREERAFETESEAVTAAELFRQANGTISI